MRHRIHLKGPWQVTWLTTPPAELPASDNRLADGLRIRLPVDWQSVFGPVAGRVRFSRVFHCPTNLTEQDRVSIVFDGVGGAATVSLNEHPLGGVCDNAEPVRFEVTQLLSESNRLVVEVSYQPAEHGLRGGLWAPVAVEIDSASES